MQIGKIVTLAVLLLIKPISSQAWHYEGHRDVTALAIASLPEDFPAFARSAAASERALFLSGEPDRWRNLRDAALKHINDPDHYIDLEEMELYGLTRNTLPELRNDLLGIIYMERSLHPEKFPVPEKEDLTKVNMLFGMLPYSINENFLKLKSEFTYLRDMQNKGSAPEEIAQAEQNIIYTMGILSHFAGDGSQPLHVTVHHHGWVGENPNGYTTDHGFHSWIDGGYMEIAQITFEGMKDRVKPAASIWPGETVPYDVSAFPIIMDYLEETRRRTEPLYQLMKDGKLDELKPSPEGTVFIEEQLLRGGQFLGSLYYSAYKSAQSVPLFSTPSNPVPAAVTNEPAAATNNIIKP